MTITNASHEKIHNGYVFGHLFSFTYITKIKVKKKNIALTITSQDPYK